MVLTDNYSSHGFNW